MKYIELKGSLREIGRAHGEAFRDDIRRYYEFYCGSRGKTPESLPDSIKSYVKNNLPGPAEEITGIAEGAGMGYEEILVYNHFNVITGCTPVYFRNSDRGPLIGQTLDCEPEELEAVLVRNVKPEKGNAYLSVSFAGTVWVGNFLSESGIGRGGVSAHHSPYLKEDGTSMGIMDSVIARQASDVREVVKILEPHRLIGKIGVLLYAQASGRAVMIEGNAYRRWMTEIEEDFAFSTGLFTTGKVEAQDEPDYIRPKKARKKTIDELRAGGGITFTVDGLKRLFAHHAPDPGSVCRHNREAGGVTRSARICVLRERKILVTSGPPCTAEFEEFSLKC